MQAIDLHRTINKSGNFLTLIGIADTHFLCDSEDEQAYQPLDKSALNYLRHCVKEIQGNKAYYGEPLFYTGGDLTELHRSSVRKVLRQLHKNDSKGEDTIHKHIIHHAILPKLKAIIGKDKLLGGVAGNHLIQFCGGEHENSEQYIIQRLGGQYCGEGKMLINLHLSLGPQKCLKKIIVTHGSKAGTKTSIIRELQDMYYQYGKIDLLIKCHAHDPMTHFHCKYNLPDSVGGKIHKEETLVMCLGSTRGGEKMGYDDYTERGNYQPHAARFPMAVFHAYKPMESNSTLSIKIRPIIM